MIQSIGGTDCNNPMGYFISVLQEKSKHFAPCCVTSKLALATQNRDNFSLSQMKKIILERVKLSLTLVLRTKNIYA